MTSSSLKQGTMTDNKNLLGRECRGGRVSSVANNRMSSLVRGRLTKSLTKTINRSSLDMRCYRPDARHSLAGRLWARKRLQLSSRHKQPVFSGHSSEFLNSRACPPFGHGGITLRERPTIAVLAHQRRARG